MSRFFSTPGMPWRRRAVGRGPCPAARYNPPKSLLPLERNVTPSSPASNVLILLPPDVAFSKRANGWRYPLVGGTRSHHFDGTNLKLRNLLENAATPTSRVHAVLAGIFGPKTRYSFIHETNYKVTQYYS